MPHRIVALGDLCRQDRTVVPPGSPLARSLPYLGLENIESVTGRILLDSADSGAMGSSNTFLFDSRHVLYSKLRPYLNKVAIPDFEGRCTTELIPLLPSPGVSREFLAWLLRRPQTVQAAMQEQTGGRMPRANLRYIFAQHVTIPDSLQEQQEIAYRMSQLMELVMTTRMAYVEQIKLLDAYAQEALAEFPLRPEARYQPSNLEQQEDGQVENAYDRA